MSYEDLDIRDGGTASNGLETYLFDTTLQAEIKRELRAQLLAYCERDTLAMMKLHQRLLELAKASHG
jgi:hypothetical protein